MGKVFDGIDEKLAGWIAAQQMFFVATAPADGGHVNLSPKGPIESLRVLDPHTIAYVDLIGSGVETVAHLRENGRICVMLCAFQGPPRILRIHGRGEVLLAGAPGFDELADGFDVAAVPGAAEGARSLIRVAIERVADSCGFDVPIMQPVGARPQRMAWLEKKLAQGDDALAEYVAAHNAESIDGLPGLEADRARAGTPSP
jgi:predicted pyridoxine 5'-phosphate oxidase superfamily flavin-nucleotide-binding protein